MTMIRRWLLTTRDLGYLGPIRVSMERSAYLGLGMVALGMFVAALIWLDGTGSDRLMGALLATLGYYLSVMVHHAGHYLAGLYAGYPMARLHFYWVLARDIYPPNEPKLAANIHLRRALGGPSASVLAALACLVLVAITPGGILRFFFLSGFWINLLIFTLGALIPAFGLDGDVIRRYWPQRRV
jgi:hypothetical protein